MDKLAATHLQVGMASGSRYFFPMDSEVVHKRWPTVANPNDLSRVGGQIVDAVQELEACWRKGALSAYVAREDIRALALPYLRGRVQRVGLLRDGDREYSSRRMSAR